jgi:hypothetical protein
VLVYGDPARTVASDCLLAEIRAALAAPPEPDRLTSALIAAGELAQGVADAEFEARGFDDLTPAQAATMALATCVARRLLGQRSEAPSFPPLPPEVRCKTPEGYAFYAVYPQAYAAAARAQHWDAPPLAIGLRSIGTSLASAVAAATGGTAISLRPGGHPFRREVRVSQRLRDRIARHLGPFAIVDEGPGLSGSSFGACADLLESLGVPVDGIVLMPSHAGEPGPQASASHLERWRRATRLVGDFERWVAGEPIAGSFADLTGPVRAIEDLSAGRWRGDRPRRDWPPAVIAQERRKYRITTPRGVFVARFAGLGRIGEGKFARGRRLHAAGFTPEPLGLRAGFLLERWTPGAPLDLARDRMAFLAHLARYLRFRATRFPAPQGAGAAPGELCEMARVNASGLCGPAHGAQAQARVRSLARLPLRPAYVDARLHAWEWLRTPDGFIKTDAIDHAEAHDLIGCQDIAWDVAGAAVEFDLSPAEVAALGQAAGATPAAVDAFRVAYAAFQGGLWAMAADAAADDERPHLTAQRDRYAAALHRLASQGATCGTR